MRPLAGLPLVLHTLEQVARASLEAAVVVSTDDDEVAEIAGSAGVEVIRRPSALAVAEASTESALLHALDVLERAGRTFEHVMTLPPTSPLRTSQTIDRFAALAREPSAADCLLSVHQDLGDYWVERDGSWTRLFPDAPRRQQDREPLYEENSAIYVTRVSALRATGSILGTTARPVTISRVEGFDINDEIDFEIAEVLLRRERR